MENFFLKLLEMSGSAGFMILAVMLLRLLFRKAPKWSICLLWGVVALRLVCPFSLESPLSLMPRQTPVSETVISQVQPQETVQTQAVSVSSPAVDHDISQIPEAPKAVPSRGPAFWCTCIWGMVAAGMVLYALVSFLLLKRRVRTATWLKENLWQSEFVSTPFVLGLLWPRVYLPYGLSESQLVYIGAHEQAHIRRGDHLIKPLGFLILSLHWFNPLVWVAYILLCRDIEAACDERVVKHMTHEQRQSYSATLLRCSYKPSIAACPVAFGGGNVKARIKGIMNYQKAGFWVVASVLVFTVTLGICFLTEPPAPEPEQPTINTENFAHINELLDEILASPRATDDYMSPGRYWVIDYDAHRALLNYGQDTINCFLPHLRQAEEYGHREQVMVMLCAQILGQDVARCDYKNPGSWLAQYDSKNGTTADRLAPGIYRPEQVLYTREPCPQDDFWRIWDRRYYVTNDAVYFMQRNGVKTEVDDGYVRQYSDDSTQRRSVDWKWETVDSELKELIPGSNYRYQNLGSDAYLLETDIGLYIFHMSPDENGNNSLEYVFNLS